MADENIDLQFIGRQLVELRASHDDFRGEVRERLDTLEKGRQATDAKIDKLRVEMIGVKGRIGKIEDSVESIAAILSRAGLLAH